MQTMCAQLGGRVTPQRPPGIRPRLYRHHRRVPAVRRAVAKRRARAGVDEPRRQGRRAAARLSRGGGQRRRALRRDRRRRAAVLRRAVPPRGRAHAAGRRSCCATSRIRSRGCRGDWTMAAFRAQAIDTHPPPGRQRPRGLRPLRRRRFRGRRGAAARGDRRPADLHLRRYRPVARWARPRRSCSLFRGHYNIPLVHRDAGELFLDKLAGVTDPEEKRKTIGATFIDVFDEEAHKIGGVEFLAQGTLYPDVIESVSATGGPSVTIKSHHNVGGLPARMKLKLVEPLRELFKDEVRALGRELGLPERVCRPPPVPRPGPGDPHPRRGHPRQARHPAQGRRGLPRGDPQRRPLRRDLAGLRGVVAGAARSA